jgi:hypothetical protein
LVKQKKYYHFLHAYNEIVIDMEREEVWIIQRNLSRN